jgi:hypothetical protein
MSAFDPFRTSGAAATPVEAAEIKQQRGWGENHREVQLGSDRAIAALALSNIGECAGASPK